MALLPEILRPLLGAEGEKVAQRVNAAIIPAVSYKLPQQLHIRVPALRRLADTGKVPFRLGLNFLLQAVNLIKDAFVAQGSVQKLRRPLQKAVAEILVCHQRVKQGAGLAVYAAVAAENIVKAMLP